LLALLVLIAVAPAFCRGIGREALSTDYTEDTEKHDAPRFETPKIRVLEMRSGVRIGPSFHPNPEERMRSRRSSISQLVLQCNLWMDLEPLDPGPRACGPR